MRLNKNLNISKIIICVLMLTVIFTCAGCKPAAEVRVNTNESFFSDFYVLDNKVYIKCELLVQNTFGIDKAVKFSALCEDDKAGGLLKEAQIAGYQADYIGQVFSVKPGDNALTVYFIGEFGGTEIKQNRLLPQITAMWFRE